MSDDRLAHDSYALPAPMTIGRYVRENFRPIASKFMWWAIIAAPASIAIKTRGSHFSIADRVGMVLLTWVIAAIGISAIVAICLSIAGWFKLHTSIRPIIPASIALAIAVLGYVAVFNFY